MAAAVVYIAGCIVMTASFHVPRHDALATLDPTAAMSRPQWHNYLDTWTAGNHVRAAAGVVAAALYIVALVAARSGNHPGALISPSPPSRPQQRRTLRGRPDRCREV